MNDRLKRQHDGELERRLDAYSRARLSPDRERMAQIRSQVLTEARRTLAEPVPASPALLVVGGTTPRRRRVGGWRRTAIALLAASLSALVLASGAFAASRAGGPLYQTRLWIENATLPTDPTARADAEMTHLQARLDEARDAAGAGDESAVAAALAAYRDTVDEALAAAGENHDVLARLEIELSRHQVVLETLQTRLPPNAADAIKQVLDRGSHALDVIHQRGGPNSGGNGNNNGGGNNGGGNGPPTDKPGGKPTDKPGPDAPPNQGGASQHPDKTPKGPSH